MTAKLCRPPFYPMIDKWSLSNAGTFAITAWDRTIGSSQHELETPDRVASKTLAATGAVVIELASNSASEFRP